MLTIALVHFEKLKNSTRRPDIFLQENLFQGEIKGDFTMAALDVTFEFNDPTSPPEYNYAYIYPFERFYFISGWAFTGGLWTASLVCDVLATYRDKLFDSAGFCVRSASMSDGGIMDASYPTTGGVVHFYSTAAAADFWGNGIDSGSIVAGIVGNSGRNVGAVTYYAMSYSVFNSFMNSLLSSISWAGISTDEISQELQKALINPAQYIVSCVWVPVSLGNQYGTIVNSVRLGWWNFSLSGNAVVLNNPSRTFTKTFTLSVPKHPQAEARGGYLNLSPYTRYTFKFLPFGVFELDSTQLRYANNIYVTVTMNPMTGDAVLDIGTGDAGNPELSILTSQANVAVQIPTGQVAANLGNFDNALLAGAVAGAADLTSTFKESLNVASGVGGGGTYGGGGGRR